MASPMDNEIQFLGSKPSSSTLSSTSVSAVVLTQVSPSSSSQRSMTFTRELTPVVHVGRNGIGEGVSESKAAFASSVVSRNHAKITFADSGTVFIIDTNSHHGTWLIRSADHTKLTPESPYQLQDGDKITFGKEVDKDGIFHQPVSVIVKLLYSLTTPSSSLIPKGHILSEHPLSPKPPKRFGIQASSESEDSNGEESDHDSVLANKSDIKGFSAKEDITHFTGNFENRPADYSPMSPSHSNGSSSSDDAMDPISEDTQHDALFSSDVFPSALTIPSIRRFVGFPLVTQLSPSSSLRLPRLLRPESEVQDTEQIANHHEDYHHGRHFFQNHLPHPFDNEKSSEENKESASLSERVDALIKEVDNLKEKQRNMQLWDSNGGIAKETETLLAANLQKLRETVNTMQFDMTTLKSHKVGMQTDIRFLRADDDARKEELKDLKARLTDSIDEMRASVNTLRENTDESKMDLNTTITHVKNLLYDVKNSVTGLEDWKSFKEGQHNDHTHIVNATTERLDREIQDLRVSLADQGLTSQMKEVIRGEIRKMIDEYNTIVPPLGKRKRDDEDPADSKDGIATPRAKRSKLSNKLLIATVIGAVGAWVSLAFW